MSEQDGLICAYVLDGHGGGRELHWPDLDRIASEGFSWVHLHLDNAKTRHWLTEKSELPEIVVEALTYDEVRPRCTPLGEGLLINLRGVNLNPGADPEDMVSVRMYIDARRAVTVRRRRMMAVNDIRERIATGSGPVDAADFLVELATRLVERMGPVIADLDDEIDALEDKAIADAHSGLRAQLWDMRRVAIELRRYIAPQRDAMARLVTERVPWIDAQSAQRLREVADRITRYVEDLDAARERAAIIQDELTTRLAEVMNRNMYVLSVIAAIFLPLSLLTGLLGINVGGIPGVEWEWAFWSVAAAIVVIGVAGYLMMRRLRWV